MMAAVFSQWYSSLERSGSSLPSQGFIFIGGILSVLAIAIKLSLFGYFLPLGARRSLFNLVMMVDAFFFYLQSRLRSLFYSNKGKTAIKGELIS
jgi:hypothetical protein